MTDTQHIASHKVTTVLGNCAMTARLATAGFSRCFQARRRSTALVDFFSPMSVVPGLQIWTARRTMYQVRVPTPLSAPPNLSSSSSLSNSPLQLSALPSLLPLLLLQIRDDHPPHRHPLSTLLRHPLLIHTPNSDPSLSNKRVAEPLVQSSRAGRRGFEPGGVLRGVRGGEGVRR